MTDKMYCGRGKKGKFVDGLSDNNETHQKNIKRKKRQQMGQ